MSKQTSPKPSKNVAADFTELLRCLISNEVASTPFSNANFKSYDESLFANACKSEEELKRKLGKRYLYRHLTLLGSLCEMYKFVTSREHVSTVNIPTTGKNTLAVFKSPMVVSRLLKLSDKIGLTVVVGEKYQFNCRASYCRKRAWNKQVQDLICQMVEKYGLNEAVAKAVAVENLEDGETDDPVPVEEETSETGSCEKDIEKDYGADFVATHYNVDLSAKLMIGHCSDETAKGLIYAKYPQVKVYQALADKMNVNLDGMNRVRFSLNIRHSAKGYITKIGCRATNKVCQLHSKEKAEKLGRDVTHFDGLWREEYLKWYFNEKGITNWMEYDQKASIYFLSNYKWNGVFETEDLYAKMFGCKLTDEQRRLFKLCFTMRASFDTSAKAVYCHLKENLNAFDKKHMDKAVVCSNGEIEPYSLQLIRFYYNRVQDVMHNTNKNTSIFLDESCIYMDVVNHIRKHGYDVVQVYDAFYIGSKEGLLPTSKQVQNVIEYYAKRYFKSFYNIDPA